MAGFTLNGEEYAAFAFEYFAELTKPLDKRQCDCCLSTFEEYKLRTSQLDNKRYCITCTNKLFHIVDGVYQRRD